MTTRPVEICLWFKDQAEEAAAFYTSLVPGSGITSVARQGDDGPVFTVSFLLGGQPFLALNGGADHAFTEATSVVLHCADQPEVDRYWEALTSDGGVPGRCGWLVDRFGLSWQVVPDRLGELLTSPDRDAAARAQQAMLAMDRLVIADLEAAARG